MVFAGEGPGKGISKSFNVVFKHRSDQFHWEEPWYLQERGWGKVERGGGEMGKEGWGREGREGRWCII